MSIVKFFCSYKLLFLIFDLNILCFFKKIFCGNKFFYKCGIGDFSKFMKVKNIFNYYYI